MPWNTETYSRETLYDQVWTDPIRTVARRGGMSGVALPKSGRELGVPRSGEASCNVK